MPRAVRKVAPRAVQRVAQKAEQKAEQRDMRKAVRKDLNLRNVFFGFRQKENRKRRSQRNAGCRRSR